MLKKFGLPSLIFCSAAAAIAILLVVTFAVGAARHKHVRKASDRLGLAFCSIVIIAAAVVTLIAVIRKYGVQGLSLDGSAGKLVFGYKEKTLFSVPFLGSAARLFDKLRLVGIIAPAAVFALALMAAITVSAKSYRVKNQVSAYEEWEAGQAETNEQEHEPESESAPVEEADEPVQEDAEPTESADEPIAEDITQDEPEEELPEEEDAISAEKAMNIIEQVDELISDAGSKSSTSKSDKDIAALLRTAIEEGNALFEKLTKSAEEKREESVAESIEEQIEEPAKAPSEEKKPEPEAESATVELSETFAKFPPKREIEVTDYEQHEEERAPRDARVRTSVRTIIRRPVARSVDALIERADGTPPKDKKPDKTVVAEESALPVTRKYVILNRRNAATVFNDYLNSKRKQEKEEITGSLNTIIMK